MNVSKNQNRIKVADVKMLDLLTMKHDQKGLPVPFYIEYQCRDGSLMKEHNVVCTRKHKQKGTRDIMMLDSIDRSDYAREHGYKTAQVRTIRDCLIVRINDTKIIMS